MSVASKEPTIGRETTSSDPKGSRGARYGCCTAHLAVCRILRPLHRAPIGEPDQGPNGPTCRSPSSRAGIGTRGRITSCGDEPTSTFSIGRNPDPGSTLPYLLRVPLATGDLILKARDTWPRTAKVYCHRTHEWPDDVEIVEQVPVRSCVRRGVAIDLVLDRARENRSQFVFTRIQGGREAIFWQSPKTTRTSRPGIRIPARRGAGQHDLVVYVDTRERYPYRFAKQQTHVERRALPCGDYGVTDETDAVVAIVERKTLADLSRRLIDGSLAYTMAELATIERAAIVVEDRWADVFRLKHVRPGFVEELLATVQVRYPTVPVVFCETRPLAEEWTYRYLAAARALALADGDAATAPGDV